MTRYSLLATQLMLTANAISFRYASGMPWVLHDISFKLAPGEVVGLSGPSGRGKTTLGKIMAGFLPPTSGTVQIEGDPLPARGYSPVQLIFQNPELAINPRWRIGQALAEGMRAPSSELLRAFSIEPAWLTRWPHELSGGELQRIAVARALGPGTRYVIADEITTMLDANTQAQIWHALAAHVRAHGMGVLIISHDAPLLARLCSRVVNVESLSGGRMNAESTEGSQSTRRLIN